MENWKLGQLVLSEIERKASTQMSPHLTRWWQDQFTRTSLPKTTISWKSMKYFDSKDGGRIGGSLKSFPIQFSKLWLVVIDLRIRSRSPDRCFRHTSYCVLCTIVQAAVYQYSQTANKLFLQRAQHKLGRWRKTQKLEAFVKQTCMELSPPTHCFAEKQAAPAPVPHHACD